MIRLCCERSVTIIFAGMLGVACSAGAEDLPLPAWSQEELRAVSEGAGPLPMLGGALLPEGMVPPESAPGPLLRPPSIAESLRQKTHSSGDVSLFVPDALISKIEAKPADETPSPTPMSELHDLDSEFVEACLDAPAEERLLDPTSVVAESQREDISRFLQFHARDARVDAYLLVIDRDQRLPEGADLSRIASGALLGGDACLAVYPLGEPWRARLFMSSSVHESVAPKYLSGLLEDCSRDALQVSDPLEQLHRFAVRLSIRLFWLEKVMPAKAKTAPLELARPAVQLPEVIAEMPPPPVEMTRGKAGVEWAALIRDPRFIAAALSVLLIPLLIIILRARHVSYLRTHVWHLPEVEAPVRLGGAFSGGAGAIIQFR
jgi:hypothetical protein